MFVDPVSPICGMMPLASKVTTAQHVTYLMVSKAWESSFSDDGTSYPQSVTYRSSSSNEVQSSFDRGDPAVWSINGSHLQP